MSRKEFKLILKRSKGLIRKLFFFLYQGEQATVWAQCRAGGGDDSVGALCSEGPQSGGSRDVTVRGFLLRVPSSVLFKAGFHLSNK